MDTTGPLHDHEGSDWTGCSLFKIPRDIESTSWNLVFIMHSNDDKTMGLMCRIDEESCHTPHKSNV